MENAATLSHISWHFQNFRRQLHGKSVCWPSFNLFTGEMMIAHAIIIIMIIITIAMCMSSFSKVVIGCIKIIFFVVVFGSNIQCAFLFESNEFVWLNVNCFAFYFVRAIVCGFVSMGKMEETQFNLVSNKYWTKGRGRPCFDRRGKINICSVNGSV